MLRRVAVPYVVANGLNGHVIECGRDFGDFV